MVFRSGPYKALGCTPRVLLYHFGSKEKYGAVLRRPRLLQSTPARYHQGLAAAYDSGLLTTANAWTKL